MIFVVLVPAVRRVYYTLCTAVNCSVDFQAYSGYTAPPCAQPNIGYVDLNGIRVWNAGWCRPDPRIPSPRGVNLITIDPFSCRQTGYKQFDTCAADADDLAAYLSYLRDGAIVVGVTGDEPTQH